MKTTRALILAGSLAIALAGCSDGPESDQIGAVPEDGKTTAPAVQQEAAPQVTPVAPPSVPSPQPSEMTLTDVEDATGQ